MKTLIVSVIFVTSLATALAQSHGGPSVQPAVAANAFAVEFGKLKAEMENCDRSTKTLAAYRAAAAPLIPRGIELARSQSGSNSLAVLSWLLSEQGDAPETESAGALLIERHLDAPETLKLADRHAWTGAQWPLHALRAIADAAHLPDETRAHALYSSAWGLQIQLDRKGDARLEVEAKHLFRELATKYPSLKHLEKTWAEVAAAHLYELEHLTLGKPAPDIEGEDIDGVKFKLSDYRGKVVLLDFWGDWCGPCREIYKEGPALLKQHAGKPFAIVAVNSDDDRAKLKRRAKEAGVTWRYFWDGGKIGGPIATRWNIIGWPMLYVIDHRGIIRAKYLRGAELERVIEECVREAGP